MGSASQRKGLSSPENLLLLAIVALRLLFHFLFGARYGYFRDEFYYLACGEHLDWGYVDHPPLVALIAHSTRTVLGESLLALRLPAAVAGALTILLTGLIARELGGGRFAQGLAALSALIAPIFLALTGFFSMNGFDLFFWALAAYLVILIIKHDRPILWVPFGLVAGLGLMNKYSMGFFGFGLVVGLVLTPARRYLANKWLWVGGALACLILLPHVLWQFQHGFPTREFIRNATEMKIAPTTPLQFLTAQGLLLHPIGLVVWLAGLGYLMATKAGAPYRVLGWIFLAVLGFFLATRAKPYYLAPAFVPLLAAGGVALEAWLRPPKLAWMKPALVALLAGGGAVTTPFAMPVLPVEAYIRYADFFGLQPPSGERTKLGKLPQHYADMFGWEEMVATVAQVYQSLPAEERQPCAIFTGNYGEAGAIDFFGKRYGLPKAISGHNNYWLWGPGPYTGEIVIVVGGDLEALREIFDDVRLGAIHAHPYAMPYESNLPVYVCRKPKLSLPEIWPRTKHYI
jgi:hypothetical protein